MATSIWIKDLNTVQKRDQIFQSKGIANDAIEKCGKKIVKTKCKWTSKTKTYRNIKLNDILLKYRQEIPLPLLAWCIPNLQMDSIVAAIRFIQLIWGREKKEKDKFKMIMILSISIAAMWIWIATILHGNFCPIWRRIKSLVKLVWNLCEIRSQWQMFSWFIVEHYLPFVFLGSPHQQWTKNSTETLHQCIDTGS